MGMNMTEKILARHAGLDAVTAGQLIFCRLDMVLANDVTALDQAMFAQHLHDGRAVGGANL